MHSASSIDSTQQNCDKPFARSAAACHYRRSASV